MNDGLPSNAVASAADSAAVYVQIALGKTWGFFLLIHGRNRMHIMFEIGGRPAEFRRNPNTGRADLLFADQVIQLQSP